MWLPMVDIVDGVERGDLSGREPFDDTVAVGEFGTEWREGDGLGRGRSEGHGLYRWEVRSPRFVEEGREPWLDGGHRGAIALEGRALETVRALP